MQALDNQPALPFRSYTILGACEAIGEDFGFNPTLLRVPFAAIVLWSPAIAVASYLGLGLVVLASRMLFPNAKSVASAAQPALPAAANSASEQELSLAA